MTTTYAQLRSEVRKVANWLVQVVSTCTAGGTATYLIDTNQWVDTNQDSITSDAPRGTWILRPSAGSTSDRERRAGGTTTVDVVLGYLYQSGAVWATPPAQAESYELWGIQPSVAFALLVETMENLLQAAITSVPMFLDADMAESGVSAWTNSNTPPTKDSTVSHSGAQSLKLAPGTAAAYSESPTIYVPRGQTCFGAMIAMVANGSTVSFAVWDKDNNVEIEAGSRVSSSAEDWMSLQRTFQVPSNCDRVTFRAYTAGASDVAWVDCFHGPRFTGETIIPLPSTVNRASDVRKVLGASYRQSTNSLFIADARQYIEAQPFIDYYIRINPSAMHPARIEVARTGGLLTGELWIEHVLRAGDVTAFAFTAAGETSPATTLPKRLVAMEWTRRMCEYVLSYLPDDPEASRTLSTLNDPVGELALLMRDHLRSLETPSYEPASPLVSRRHIV